MGEFGYERNKVGCECRVTEVASGYQKQFFRMAGQQVRIHEVCILRDQNALVTSRKSSNLLVC